MSRPSYLLLDEPSMGLSPLFVESVCGLIRDLARSGLGILLAEQNASMALAIADFGYVMDQGEIVLSGTGTELGNNDGVRRAYLAFEEPSTAGERSTA
jgi:branched-chain amino acid transport system ATP-binding protein